jgi:hypothetical protein
VRHYHRLFVLVLRVALARVRLVKLVDFLGAYQFLGEGRETRSIVSVTTVA